MLRRISNLFKGFLSLFVSDLERSNPEALLEVERENLREQIAKFNQGLASHAAMSERLMAQVKKEEAEVTRLEAKTKANLQAGNREAAGRYALKLKEVREELAENRQQLEQAEATYKNLTRAREQSVDAARKKIEDLQQQIGNLKAQKAMAELHEMASGMISQIGSSGDTLDRLERMVEDERVQAAGRARVARDSVDVGDLDATEAETEALEDMALADFAAEHGIALEPSAASVATAPGASPLAADPTAETAPAEDEDGATGRSMGTRSPSSETE